jgi:L-alanine-DL-glutamate epimerase-like enolase superfamily enzyme
MKITEMHITPIAITDPPLLNAAGLHAPYALRIIVELVTDDNIYGLGEVPGSESTRAALEDARESSSGMDPFQLNAIQQGLQDRFGEGSENRRAANRHGTSAAWSTSTAPSRSPASTHGQGDRPAGGRSTGRSGA